MKQFFLFFFLGVLLGAAFLYITSFCDFTTKTAKASATESIKRLPPELKFRHKNTQLWQKQHVMVFKVET